MRWIMTKQSGEPYELTEEDLKTLVYLDTTTEGIGDNFETPGDYNYYLPSFTRYQLCNGAYIVKNGRRDENGALITDREDGLERIPLTDSQYSRWAKIGQYEETSNNREAPAVIKHNGTYYMIASGISGWKANQGIYLRTDDLFGEWETVDNPFEGEGQTDYSSSYSYNKGYWTDEYLPDRSKSFLSQSTGLFEVNGSVYYMGDRWMDGDYANISEHYGVKKSTYVWLPVTFTENTDTGKTDMDIYWSDTLEFDNEISEYLEPLGAFKNILTIEKKESGNRITLEIKPKNGETIPTLTMYCAVYNADGTLNGLTSAEYSADENGGIEIVLERPQVENGGVFKIMLWDKNQSPVIGDISD